VISFKRYLTESVGGGGLEDLARDYVKALHAKWMRDFPDEAGIDDVSYMKEEFFRLTHNAGPWIFDKIRSGDFVDSVGVKSFPKDAEACSRKVGRCYYNALDFVNRNGTKYGDLAYVIIINKGSLGDAASWAKTGEGPRPFLFDILEHGVILTKDNKILDPTLGRYAGGKIAVYHRVPESTWKNFSYKPNDSNQDARAFYDDYILKEIEKEKKSFNFKSWMLKG